MRLCRLYPANEYGLYHSNTLDLDQNLVGLVTLILFHHQCIINFPVSCFQYLLDLIYRRLGVILSIVYTTLTP